MLRILSANGVDEVLDCAKLANNNESPVTYGDIYNDFQGNPLPLETVLTDSEDLLTQQTLDYVFVVRRKAQLDASLFTNQDSLLEEVAEKLTKGSSGKHEKYI